MKRPDEAAIPAIGHRIESRDVVESTNDVALELLRSGAAHGTVVTAREQRAGRGRRGRTWWSPPGNFYASVVVRPASGAPAGQLSFVAAVAAAAAIGADVPVRFKWPNDLLIDRRKVGGILIEAEAAGAVVGLGVNIASAPEGTPYPATSLAEAGRRGIVAGDLLAEVCPAFESWYGRWEREGFAPVREAWLARAAGVGEPISVKAADGEFAGVFAALDGNGALVLETAAGSRRITSGEVFFGRDRCC